MAVTTFSKDFTTPGGNDCNITVTMWTGVLPVDGQPGRYIRTNTIAHNGDSGVVTTVTDVPDGAETTARVLQLEADLIRSEDGTPNEGVEIALVADGFTKTVI